MTPEAQARERIDQRLVVAGWVLQDMKQLNLGAAREAKLQRHDILRAALSGQLVQQHPDNEPASVLLEPIRVERATQGISSNPRGRKAKEPA